MLRMTQQKILSYCGHQVSYYTTGTGPLVVALHGWPTNARLWDAQVAAFQTRYQVLTLDWLGFGQSAQPKEYQYTFTTQAALLGQLLDQELAAGEQVTLLAHDIGGPPAILWAATQPHRVRQLILLNTILYPFSTPFEQFSQVLFQIPLLNRLLMSRFGLTQILTTNTRSRDGHYRQRVRDILDHHAHWAYTTRIQTITQPVHGGKTRELPTLAQTLAELPIPKQLIVAKGDPLCYAYMQRFIEAQPEVMVHVLDRCGHYMPLDRPQALNAILEEVLL